MAETHTTDRAEISQTVAPRTNGKAFGVLLALVLAGLAAFALLQQRPPQTVAADAPPDVFSSARALKRLEGIAQNPHPMGSLEHTRVRERITRELTELGLEPEVQTTSVVSARRANFPRGGTVSNIIARLKGTEGGKAVLLASHYDTVPNSPGASDDGAGVVTLLECLRALKAGPALKRDVVFLFTDGEEVGLLGAQAFVEEHPAAKEVGVVLNYEARGSGGPVIMFETSRDNDWLVRQFMETAPHPLANSLSYEIYRLLPNDTDFSVFKEAGMQGLNFAYIDGVMRYHLRADSLENIDERSLQHHGSYALALTRHFGNLTVPEEKAGNAIYSDVLGRFVFKYSAEWVLPLTIFMTGLLVAVTGYGLRRGSVTFKGIILGIVAFIVSVVLTTLTVALLWWLIGTVQRLLGRSLTDDFYQGKIYLAGFSALCVALVVAIYGWFKRRTNAESLLSGSQFCWAFLLLLVSFVLPGASYLLLWPLAFSLIASVFAFMSGKTQRPSLARLVVLVLSASPAIVLLVPVIYQLYVGVGLALIGAVAFLSAILLGLVAAQFGLLGERHRWFLPAGVAVFGVVLLAWAAFGFNFDKRHPRFDNVFYALNADTGKAAWASSDVRPDDWSAQFFGNKFERGAIAEFAPTFPGNYLKASAPTLPLGAPQATLLEATDTQGVRTLRLSLVPSAAGTQLTAFIDPQTEVVSAVVNGKKLGARDGRARSQTPQPWVLQYWTTPPEGIELTLEVRTSQPVKLIMVERTDGLPEIPGQSVRPRPDYLIPAAGQSSDATLVSKTYSF
ncbi:MAG TPA: M28 family metallopeptidase [Pyrinomonadaceae bacterium]|nr:M28 family metallopeptidase [Pyrinomonadaceae bacterium]